MGEEGAKLLEKVTISSQYLEQGHIPTRAGLTSVIRHDVSLA